MGKSYQLHWGMLNALYNLFHLIILGLETYCCVNWHSVYLLCRHIIMMVPTFSFFFIHDSRLVSSIPSTQIFVYWLSSCVVQEGNFSLLCLVMFVYNKFAILRLSKHSLYSQEIIRCKLENTKKSSMVGKIRGNGRWW